MSSIIRDRDTYHGISVFGRGMFTNDELGVTYAGQVSKDGHACGLGVATRSGGDKVYAEHGPDGYYDGLNLYRWADGHTFYYSLYERSKSKDSAVVSADGSCYYNGEDCAPNDPRLLALIAQVAPVEVRPAAPALNHHTSPTRHQVIFRWICRLGLPPQALATAMATEVHPHAARCATQPNHQSHCNARPRSDACTGRFAEVVTREALLHPNNRRLVHTEGPSRQRRCHAIVQHAAC
jgi:hypothetical protein